MPIDFYSLHNVYAVASELAYQDKQTEVLYRQQGSMGCHPLKETVSNAEKHFAHTAYDLLGIQKERWTVCQFVHACEASNKLTFHGVMDAWVEQADSELQKMIRPQVRDDLVPVYDFNMSVLKHFKESLYGATKTNPITDITVFSKQPSGMALDDSCLKHCNLGKYPVKFFLYKYAIDLFVQARGL